MSETYTYTKTPVNLIKLNLEILAEGFSETLEKSKDTLAGSDNILITFAAALPGGEVTTLGTVVTNHDGDPPTTYVRYCGCCGRFQETQGISAPTDCPYCGSTDIKVDSDPYPKELEAVAGTDIPFKMGDNAGVNKISFTDSDDVEVASLDSDGNLNINALYINDPGSAEYGSIVRNSNDLIIDSGIGARYFSLVHAGVEKFRIDSYITCIQSIRPSTDSVYHLGLTTQRWLKIWGDELNIETINIFEPTQVEYGIITRDENYLDVDCGDDGAAVTLSYRGDTRVYVGNTAVQYKRNIEPVNTSVYDMGKSTAVWKDLYVERILLYDDSGVENAIVSRSLDDFELYGGAGCTYMKLGITEYEILISNNVVQFAADHYPTSDSLWNNGLNTRYWKNLYADSVHIDTGGKINLERHDGDTYLTYNSGSSRIEFWLNGTLEGYVDATGFVST